MSNYEIWMGMFAYFGWICCAWKDVHGLKWSYFKFQTLIVVLVGTLGNYFGFEYFKWKHKTSVVFCSHGS